MEYIEEQFVFLSEKLAEIAQRAVLQELDNSYEKRSKAEITTNKNVVLLKITADDGHAKLASYHSYKRLLELSRSLMEV